jgi:hypothetical protein
MNLSQQDLALDIHVLVTQLSKMEDGYLMLSIDIVQRKCLP